MKRISYFIIPSVWMPLVMGSLIACESLQRHPDSGYSTFGEQGPLFKQVEFERKAYEESFAKEELGLNGKYFLTPQEQAALGLRLKLKMKEQRLTTNQEKRQYYSYKSQLNSDQERLYFLSLPSIEQRERYVIQRGVASQSAEHAPVIASLIESKDITVGMTQKAVMESWGDPDAIEVAGNPVYGNERWKYSKYVSSEAGYKRELRYVYFENGIVSGWESF